MYCVPKLGSNIEPLNMLANLGNLDKESKVIGIVWQWPDERGASLSKKQLYLFLIKK